MHNGGGHLVVLSTFAKEVEFLPPSNRACEAGFGAFEKMKCIFSIAPVENLEKLRPNVVLGDIGHNIGRCTGHALCVR
jgi:hypothetical protein